MIYETIYRKLTRIIPHLDEMEVGNAVTLTADGYMDLHVDILHRGTYKDMDTHGEGASDASGRQAYHCHHGTGKDHTGIRATLGELPWCRDVQESEQ